MTPGAPEALVRRDKSHVGLMLDDNDNDNNHKNDAEAKVPSLSRGECDAAVGPSRTVHYRRDTRKGVEVTS